MLEARPRLLDLGYSKVTIATAGAAGTEVGRSAP